MLAALIEMFLILILVLANGVFAGSEIALVSASRSRLRSRMDSGDDGARVALELTESPIRFLSTLQIGITLVGITAGALGASTLANTIANGLAAAGLASSYATAVAIAMVVGATAFLTLVVGELVPKRLALGDPEAVAVRVARPMRMLARIAAPAVHLLSASTEFVLRLLPWRIEPQLEVTEEEIERMVAEATASGILEKTEQDVVRRLFRLSDRNVDTLMTPRERIVWLDLAADPGTRLSGVSGAGHSRFVVCENTLDDVRGYVKVQDLFDLTLEGEAPKLEKILRKPHVVAPWTPAFRILERFQRSGDHIALVQDPAGRITGLVTLNDILSNIVGDFPEPHELERPEAVRRPDGSWLMDGLMSLEEAFLRLDSSPSAPEGFPTLHAFVVEHLGASPSAAQSFHWDGLRFEVVDMDGSRVDKVMVGPEDPQPEP